ncbi:hypothetical protein J4E86_002385 [Alternaria arbusti]|uniref:uncharacterized protein n=1 Tax=Alternaria arbusti TaxID=232088 RepID=UPI00221FF310|nr:uncharacterized protein J4E86_002385 [Alternaria arbusti]KAI4960760.1 hypothetical protein J4E86_002385 [Alternaria arbusti]
MEKSQALSAGPNAAKKPTVNDERMAQDRRLPPYPQSGLPNSEPEHAESSENDGALSWITAMKPSEFKSRSKMQTVRQTAMGSYLKANKGGARKPNMEASDHPRTNETPRSRRMTSHNTASTLDSSLSPPHSVAESSGGTTEAVPRPLFQALRHDHFYSTADADEEYARSELNTNFSSGQASSFQDPVAHTALEEGPSLKKARHGKTDIKTGLAPPPDPRPAAPLDCHAEISLDVVRDIFLTFEGSIGLYILVNGLLQIIVPDNFDTEWASSHLPHKYGGLKVCYIERTLEPTMLSKTTETSSIGKIGKTFDKEAGNYPDGFLHDVTLIEAVSLATLEGLVSPFTDLASLVFDIGWLRHDSWAALRQQTTTVKLLADSSIARSLKSIQGSRPSDILVVGEGIFLNQKAAAGGSKNLKEHDAATWKDLVSRALLYRVHPDFDPPEGHSGTALYADGVREDGTYGPGIVGFQSFVQRSGHVQNFEMEGPALERRLQLGRVAFYGAFEVPAGLKEYDII